MYHMTFYCSKNADGLIHVQNAIIGMMGQHHVHDGAGFAAWANNPPVISNNDIVWLEGALKTKDCDCGLGNGEVKDGR
jgi:hypothetical protein